MMSPHRRARTLLLLCAAQPATAPSEPDANTYSCGATVVLPSEHNGTRWAIGVPPAEDKSLATLRSQLKVDVMEYMHARAGAGDGSSAMSAMFVNFRRQTLERRWVDGSKEGVYTGNCPGLGQCSTNSYIGHRFTFVDPVTKAHVMTHTMRPEATIYIVPPAEDDAETLASDAYAEALAEARWREEYHAHHGTSWLSAHPRPPPEANMWPAERLGQVHTVTSPHGFWRADGSQGGGGVAVNLTVISRGPDGPRAFLINDLLSEAECEHIIEHGEQVVSQSTVGNGGEAHIA
jgi:hypothetical protein